jgi:hypothetical protein
MFCTLRRNPTDCLPDLSPAGTLISGRHGRLVTEAIRRTSQEISELNQSKRGLASFGDSGHKFAPAALYQGLDQLRSIR